MISNSGFAEPRNKPRWQVRKWLLTLVSAGLYSATPAFAVEPSAEDAKKLEFFEKKIRPLFVANCYNCHSADNGGRGGLRVDDRNGLIEGGNRGPGIKPGRPEDSLIIKAVKHEGGLQMPPKAKLSDEEIADLEAWIRDGAVWPKPHVDEEFGKPKPGYEKLRNEHWAWQPIQNVTPPTIAENGFVFNDIDRFIAAKLSESKLQPVGDADRTSLIRRVTFDLTGLPPTPEEITQFVDDISPNAFEKVVDRLLASPAYGERWGRHWLDVARYGESSGSARNIPFPHAWRYRDYVIDSFTSDKPYNQFIREQIAGDLLPANSPNEKVDQLVATGFLALGVKDVNQRFKIRFTMDNIDEQIDTVSRSVLGLTASCARCHDHKFDPIPQTDYYALAGIFHSSDLLAGVRSKMGGGGLDYYDTNMLLSIGEQSKTDPNAEEKIEAAKKAVEVARTEFEAIRGKPEGMALGPNGRPKQQMARQRLNRAQQELSALTDPAVKGKVAYGVREGKKIGDIEARIRGEAEKLGPVVPRGFLSVAHYDDEPKINSYQSGRLELAYWLTSEKNPLTRRVVVNRIWQHLFQQGIVTTVDNFGVNGATPSHPELLDYLANQFVSESWSFKKLIRTIVLSHTYRLSAEATTENVAVDPANRLLWRHSPRRLEAEEIRDAMLAAANKLDRTRPEGSLAKDFKVIEMRNNGAEARRLGEDASIDLHRSVYLPLVRGVTPRALEVFDFAEQGMVTGSRDSTTVPTQALYLLNDPFVRRQALALAERLVQTPNISDFDRLQLAYQLVFGRNATPAESDRATAYIAEISILVRDNLIASAEAQKVIAVADASAQVTDEDTVEANATGSQPRGAKAKPAPAVPANPDDIDPTDAPVKEEVIEAQDATTAAWASFCQALLGTAEFRYLK